MKPQLRLQIKNKLNNHETVSYNIQTRSYFEAVIIPTQFDCRDIITMHPSGLEFYSLFFLQLKL